MQYLKIKKFFLDYLIGSGLMIVLFFGLIGNFTIMDTRGVLALEEACPSSDSHQDILDKAQLALRDDEHCELAQPCDTFLELKCEGTATVSDLPMHVFAGDLLVFRVKDQLSDDYRFVRYSDKSTFRVPIGLISFILVYLAVLIEAGALLFALWRQKALRQTFSLSPGSKSDQVLRPLLLGVVVAMGLIALNFLVSRFVEYPDEGQLRATLAYFRTAAGVILAVLVAPILEELVFRGVLLRFFVERSQQLLGFVLVSIAFATIHVLWEEHLGWQLYRFGLYFLISTVLCWAYIKQKTLWSPIILHASYNATMVGFLNIVG